MVNSSGDILKTLLYSDIFNYPLSKEEIWQYLISSKKNKAKDISLEIGKAKDIDSKKDFYFLKGRSSLVVLREKREKESLIKLKKAEKVINKLFLIPTIKLIGISGNLALKNADKKDDIDLFIITKKDTIWITRFLVVAVLRFLGVYRKRADKNVKDKFCSNMFLDETNLSFAKKRQDIFTAHELVQLKPIKDRKDTYIKLVNANKWILNFLPNSIGVKKEKLKRGRNKESTSLFLKTINNIVKFPQIVYMKKHKTSEEISDRMLAFHPQNHKNYVLEQYEKRLQEYNL